MMTSSCLRALLAAAGVATIVAVVGGCVGDEIGAGPAPTPDAGAEPPDAEPPGANADANIEPPKEAGGSLAVLIVDPVQHDFGTVDAGQAARKSFTVKNDGDVATASLQAKFTGAVPGPYRISIDGCAGVLLAPRATCSLEVEYAPTMFGENISALEIGAGAQTTAKATLRGLGRDTVTLNVSKTGLGTVTGTGINCGVDCDETYTRTTLAPTVTLTATPAADHFFAGWAGGGCAGLVPTCAVPMTAARSVAATFTAKVPLNFSLIRGPGATTNVTSTPAGLVCTGECANTVALYDLDTDVTINVASTDAYRFFGDCTGTTCTLKMNKAMTVELQTTGYNYGFVSSAEYTGNLGGLAGADTKCADLATAAKLPGTFKAWLSSSTIAAKDRFASTGGWVRTDGSILATTKANLLLEGRVRNPLWLDENKMKRAADAFGERVWTNTTYDGLVYGVANSCADWAIDTAGSGIVGMTQRGIQWTVANVSPCSASERLYCLADDLSRAVPLPVITTERRAFISTTPIASDAGLAGLDALCQANATSAALPRATLFKALVAPSDGVSAASRFNALGTKWVRVDGVPIGPIGPTAVDYLGGTFTAAVDLSASGGIAQGQVLTGYRRSGTTAVPFTDPGTHTCNGWSSASAAVPQGIGLTNATGIWVSSQLATAEPSFGCDVPRYVYCFED